MNSLTPEERQHLYKLLRLKTLQHPDGTLEAEISGSPSPELVQRKPFAPATCRVDYRNYRGTKQHLAPVLTHTDATD